MSHTPGEDARDLEDLTRFIQQRGRRPREPQRISEALSRLLARRGYAQVQAVGQLQEIWNQTVGGVAARHSRPAGLKRGVLEVIVRNSTVLQELTFQKSQILRRLKNSDAGRPIADLRFRVGQID